MYEIKKKTNWQDLIMNYWDEYGTGSGQKRWSGEWSENNRGIN